MTLLAAALAGVLDHRNTGNAMGAHQRLGIGECRVGANGDGIDDHAGTHERRTAQQQPVMHDPVLHSHPQGRLFYQEARVLPPHVQMRRPLSSTC